MACTLPDSSAFVGDDLADVARRLPGWHAEPLQLGRGRPCVRVIECEVKIGAVAYLEAALDLVMQVTTLRGGVSLVIPDCGEGSIRVSGQRLAGGRFLALHRREKVDIYLPSRSSLYLLNLQLIEDPSVRFATAVKSGVPYLRSAPVPALERSLRELGAMLNGGNDAAPYSRITMSSRLVHAICALLTRSQPTAPARGSEVRRVAVDRARALIHAHPERTLRLEDLCRIAGSRPRTIEYGFREFFDVTPMGYVRNVRLNKVRQRLSRSAGKPCSISATARRWGFAHMGQFNTHYRLLFDETPSMTLARSLGRALKQPSPTPKVGDELDTSNRRTSRR